MSLSRLVSITAVTALAGTLIAASPAQAADDVTINLVGVNDFHGRIDAATVQWAGTVRQLEADAPAGQSLMISAGDNVSASLFASAVQDDNPTIDVLNALGLDASAAGNHEFDKGYDDLVNRIADRADFPILGANVTKADDSPALDASASFDVAGVRVAVVGAVTQETPSLVSPAGIEGLTFGDPVEGINDEVDRLEALPEAERPDVIVASFHEGAPDGTMSFAQAVESSAVFRHLVEDTSADVDAIFMGHTHQKYAYDAPIPGGGGATRPVIQTGNYGENVGQIKLQVNPDTGEVTSYSLRNVARSTTTDAALISTYPDLAQVKQIRDDAVAYANEVGSVPKGEITGDITTAYVGSARDDRASESSLGNLVADALLETISNEPAGADLALVNPGGLRSDLKYAGTGGTDGDGVATYAELNAVLPFANNLVSVRLSGASITKIFEQQWQRDAAGNVPSRPYLQLGTSSNVSYTFDPTLPEGSRIQSLRIDGQEIDPAEQYKVATFSFLAAGGDNFRAFTEGVTTDTGLVDRDGWIAYFEDASPVDPSYAKHAVQTTGVQTRYGVGDAVSYTLSKLDLTSLGTPAATRVISRVYYEGGSSSVGTAPVTDGTASVAFTLPEAASGAVRVESRAYAGSLPIGTKVVVPLDVTGATVSAEAESPVVYGDDSTVTVSVSGPVGVPTGHVTLKRGKTILGEGDLVDGTLTVEVDSTDLGVGLKSANVFYSGDDAYPAAQTKLKIKVNKVATTTQATPPASPVGIESPAPIEVDLGSATGTTPTGEVTVRRGTTVVGTATLEDGAATVEADLAGSKVGANKLTVSYGGDGNHKPSQTSVTVEVKKGDPGLAATADPGTVAGGAQVHLTAAPGVTGLVYVFDEGGQTVAMGLLRNGSATLTTFADALAQGSHELFVAYNGSTTFDPDDTAVTVDITAEAS